MDSPDDVHESSNLYKYHIHPQKGILSEQPLSDVCIDFGTVDSRFSDIQHHHSFFSTLSPTGSKPADPVRFSGLISYAHSGTVCGTYIDPDFMDCGEVPSYRRAKMQQKAIDIFEAENLQDGPVARNPHQ
jgi:hypothetical protein